jgi:hypothetical protein
MSSASQTKYREQDECCNYDGAVTAQYGFEHSSAVKTDLTNGSERNARSYLNYPNAFRGR